MLLLYPVFCSEDVCLDAAIIAANRAGKHTILQQAPQMFGMRLRRRRFAKILTIRSITT